MCDQQNLLCWGKQMSEPERRNPGVTLCYWIILIIVRGGRERMMEESADNRQNGQQTNTGCRVYWNC